MSNALAVWRLCWQAARWPAAAHLVCAIVAGLAPAGVAWSTKLLVDGLVAGSPVGQLVGIAAVLAGIGLLSGVLPHATQYLAAEQSRRIDRLVQDRLTAAVNSFHGLSRLEDPGFLDRLRLAMQASGTSLAPATSGLFTVGGSVITVVTLLATVFVLSPLLAIIVLAAAIPALLAQLSLTRHRVRLVAELTPATRRQFFYSSLLTELAAAKEIRLFGLGNLLAGRLGAELATVQDGERRVDRKVLRTQISLAAFGAVIAGGGLIWAARSAASGELTLGDLSAFIAAIAGAQQALSSLVMTIATAYQSLLLFGHYRYVTNLPDDLPQADGELGALRHEIELRDVWFRYDETHPWVLQGVTVKIPYGRSVALVGLNGAGKSTLVKLLCRFYDPTRGAILWDGVDIRDVPVAELRRRMGVLFQDFMSYELTAAENIGLGDVAALTDRDRIEQSAKRAGVHDIVSALPRSYDTLLSRIFIDAEEPGVQLSGGQWQRVALARTFLRDRADLLILDEPSTGLDAEAEHEIHQRLRTHRSGATSLLISHRLSAVRDADRIVVLSDGKITEQGRHDELVRADGQYARLFTLQANGYRESTELSHPG